MPTRPFIPIHRWCGEEVQKESNSNQHCIKGTLSPRRPTDPAMPCARDGAAAEGLQLVCTMWVCLQFEIPEECCAASWAQSKEPSFWRWLCAHFGIPALGRHLVPVEQSP